MLNLFRTTYENKTNRNDFVYGYRAILKVSAVEIMLIYR